MVEVIDKDTKTEKKKTLKQNHSICSERQVDTLKVYL